MPRKNPRPAAKKRRAKLKEKMSTAPKRERILAQSLPSWIAQAVAMRIKEKPE